MRIRIIVNETAGSGRAGAVLPQLTELLLARGEDCEIARTAGPGHATELARLAFDDNVECIGVIGGDGTLNEVVQAYLGPDGLPIVGPDLALLPAGTGGDFRRSLGLTDSPLDFADRIVNGQTKPVDLGVVRLISHVGKPLTRAFVNVLSFGLGGLVDKLVNQSPKWLGGRATFLIGTVRAALVYQNKKVRVNVDGELFLEQPVVNVAIANGQFFGGGMHIAPEASTADGSFDVIALGDIEKSHGVTLATRIYRGTHLSYPGVKSRRGRSISAEPLVANEEVLVDLDGETPGRLPLVADIAPKALKFRI